MNLCSDFTKRFTMRFTSKERNFVKKKTFIDFNASFVLNQENSCVIVFQQLKQDYTFSIFLIVNENDNDF